MLDSISLVVFGKTAELVVDGERGGGLGSVDFGVDYEYVVLSLALLYIVWIGRTLANLSGVAFRVSNPFAKPQKINGLGGTTNIGDVVLDWSMILALYILLSTRTILFMSQYSVTARSLIARGYEAGVAVWLLSLVVSFVVLVVWGFIVMRAMGYLLRVDDVVDNLILIKSRLLQTAVVWVLPFVLLGSLERDQFWIYYIVVSLVVMFGALFLFRTIMLFVHKKISILHWILYLCAVEIFPITFMWAIFVR